MGARGGRELIQTWGKDEWESLMVTLTSVCFLSSPWTLTKVGCIQGILHGIWQSSFPLAESLTLSSPGKGGLGELGGSGFS